MIENWQQIVVFVLVACAAAFILLRGYRTLFGVSQGCGSSCNGCGTQESESAGFVSLESLTQERSQ